MAAYTTIDNPELYFQVKAYTGTGTSTAFTLDGEEDMQPDLVWLKYRNAADSHALYDSVRGTQKILQSDRNSLEITQDNGLSAFGSDGFTIGDNSQINTSSGLFVAWCWKESADSGFDIVTASGTGSAKTISHSLSAVPNLIISKEKSGSVNDWVVYHTLLGNNKKVILNEHNAVDTDSCWNDTTPTSSVFSVGSASVTNRSGSTYVYYLWSEKQGFSKFGSFVANSQAGTNGTFVYLGFKARYFMWKNTTTGSSTYDHWNLIDTKRQTYNGNTADGYVQADETTAETSFSGNGLSVFANGVQISQGGRYHSESGSTYVYMAFAEAPFVNSNGVPCNAR